ncbi:CD48 antigen-like isoform 1-T1 [Anomaloglossus baeobatrachus]|uniref:CD48 antigen-like isoform X1 n=1 Tax=Anomaloglossus baeobatrachus TaxID=238106 RepID=UPI003F501031
MKVALFLLLSASLLDVVLATRHKERHAISQSTIHLTTSFDQTPTEVIWKHKTPENAMQIAKMQNGLMIDRLNSRYTLGPNGSDLCIHDVTERDNGFYIAEATLADNRIENEKFYLMVHEPVPPVQILSEVRRNGDQCHITLRSSVPSNASDLSYTWKYRHQDSEYQSIDTAGSTIHKILPLDHNYTEFVCKVHNPVDQKNVSVHIEQCSVKVKTRTRVPIVLFLIIIIITAAVCGVIYWTCSNRSKQGDPENQNLKTSVQDSESTFNNISHGKTNVKMKEEDVELECFEVKS